MPLLTPDPTFYPSPAMATQAPPETLGYVALVNPREGGSDALGVVDLDPASKSYGRLIDQTDMPHAGDELHHFGWNACSSCLCPYAPHPHMERRYLVVPGIHSSRIHVLDTKPDPRQPRIVKVIEPETIARRTGTRRRTPCTAGRTGFFSARSARPTATVRAAPSCSIPRRSRFVDAGSSIADRRNWPTTSGGTSGSTR